MVNPNFIADFLEAVVQEGADELTLRAEEEGMLRTFIDTTNVGDKRWKSPHVDENWHATCQAIFQGVEGSDWETMYYNWKLPEAVKCKKSAENRKVMALWSLKFLRSVQRAEDSNKIPSNFGSLCNPLEEPDGCRGRRAEAHKTKTGTVFCRRWKRNMSGHRRGGCM